MHNRIHTVASIGRWWRPRRHPLR